MSRVLLIRHAESHNNATPEHERVCDPGLTERGTSQARAAAIHLANRGLTHLFCSPFLRSLQTAEAIASQVKLNAIVRSNLFENGGCYSGYDEVGKTGEPGLSRLELTEQYPDWEIDDTISDQGWWNRDYESPAESFQRAADVASWITQELTQAGDYHALVIHADFKGLLVPALLAYGNRRLTTSESLRNTGMTEMVWDGQSWNLDYYNRVDHLTEALISG